VQSHLEKEYSGKKEKKGMLYVDVCGFFKADVKRARSSVTSSASTTSSFFARAFSDQTSRHDDMGKLIKN